MLFRFYIILTAMMAPAFGWLLSRRLKQGKEESSRLAERMGHSVRPRPDGRLIWFHGASVGESLSALPLIERLLTTYPDAHVMVTTGTVTSARLMVERLPERAFHQFMPVDHPRWVKTFVEHWQPDSVIWLESDYWPNMISQVRAHNIPMILINARMSARSFRRWSLLARKELSNILSAFDFCLTQSGEERERLKHFGHERVYVTANLKYAAAPLPCHRETAQRLKNMIAGRPVWQYASTHKGEEEIAARMHTEIKTGIANLLTVIVPRHPARGEEIAKSCEAMGLVTARRSLEQPVTPDIDVYIADTMGEMGVFFDTIDMTVMGGSFVPHGGHNPIEPAQYGNVVIFGPHMFNFKTIIDEFLSAQAAIQLEDEAALKNQIETFLRDPEQTAPYKEAARTLTLEKSRALDELWDHIAPWLGKKLPMEKRG